MTTKIPPIELDRILQIKSSPETIAALLNETEALYFKGQMRWNQKRLYPFWKVCKICNTVYAVEDWKHWNQDRNCCSKKCGRKSISLSPHLRDQKHKCKGKVITCPICGTQIYRTARTLRRVKNPTCSRRCAGVLKSQLMLEPELNQKLREWAKLGHLGWTEEGRKAYLEKISGSNNWNWKGGITYFKKKGYYAEFSIKYVKCPPEFMEMARQDGYVAEHRLIVAQHLGRPLKRTEVVHHKDHNPENNTPINLILFKSNSQHKKYEAIGKPEPLWQL